MRKHTKASKKNVYQQVSATTSLQEDTKWREDNGENDLDDIAAQGISTVFCGERVALTVGITFQ